MKIKLMLTAAAMAAASIGTASADQIQAMADEINASLAASGKNYRLEMMEYITADGAQSEGVTRFFNNRGNKQLALQFVPGDTRRVWSGPGGNSITWSRDNQNTADVSPAAQSAAIASAMATWDAQKCSDFGLAGGDVGGNTGLIFGPGVITADIMHSGFLPGATFVAFFGPVGNNILGVHFGFLFVDGGGNPTDINNDGFADKALGDIYYNDGFSWSTTGANFDIETVSLHEAGHGLSQQHFGTAFLDSGSGQLHFAPRSVMNAAYSGVQHDLTGTDKSGHCSLWASWPN